MTEKSTTIYSKEVHGAKGAERSQRSAADYKGHKALVEAHDLFMAG